MKYEKLKNEVLENIDLLKNEILEISKKIHNYAEYGTMEYKSSSLLTSKLKENGFIIETPELEPGMEQWKIGLRTAIKATYKGKTKSPLMGINAEYDALAIGHGCGHNIIAASALGASIALSKVMDGLNGTLVFLGSPAEERYVDNAGGKVLMLGEFRKLDACVQIHPGTNWRINLDPSYDKYAMYADVWKFVFKGQPGHPAAAMSTFSAQRAAILTMFAIDILHIVPPVEHIITGKGLVDFRDHEPFYFSKRGLSEIAELGIYIRQGSKEDVEKVLKRVVNCAKGAALATNTSVEFKQYAPSYESKLTNVPLASAFKDCFVELGVEMKERTPNISPGTSDFGNVSRVTPSTSASLKIGEGFRGHTHEYIQAAISEEGHKSTIIGAKAMALLALKLFTNPELVKNSRADFNDRAVY